MGSQTSVLRIREKTQEVVDHHHDETTPGKPLYLLIAGGMVALPSLGLIFWIAYRTWYLQDMSTAQAQPMLTVLAPLYIGGVFLFSYGYELYNMARALKLTAIIVFVSLAAVVIVAVLFALISCGGKSSASASTSSKSSSSTSETASSASTPSSNSVGSAVANTAAAGFNPIFIGSPGPVVTREVVREVPVAPAAPKPVVCSHCKRSYVPQENQFLCPGCGSATSKAELDA